MTNSSSPTLHPTLPWQWYTDQAHFERERRLILRTGWHHVGPIAHLNAPGQATTVTLAGMSIIIVADEEGAVRAFPNVCRHRGAELVGEVSQRVTRLQCRYHGWTWDTQGTLRAAPSADVASGDPCWALDQLPIATWGPMLFVKPGHDGPDFNTVMGPLMAEIRERVDVDALVPIESEAYSVKSNWKVWIENFNECYHCAVAHPEFTKVVHTNKRYEVERLGTYNVGHKVRLRAEPDQMYYFAYAWPTLALGVSPDGNSLGIIAIRPDTAASTTYLRQLYQPAGVEPKPLLADFKENLVQQDIDLCEMVQRGLDNGAYVGGCVVESREQAVLVFHELVNDHLLEGACVDASE
jgi:phenylpropionate dioxygenase-like ring-hydroxylating dioxygenase large terminal subunit